MEKLFVVEVEIKMVNGKPLLGYCGHATREVYEEWSGLKRRLGNSANICTITAYQALETTSYASQFLEFKDDYAVFRNSCGYFWKHKVIREENGVYIVDPKKMTVPTQTPV